jgi:glyoxylase-like metal-dependent hydrolase (beta-lactamase superfamily II)
MRIGTARLEAVIELDRVPYPAHRFFAACDDAIIARERSWTAPEHIDPASGEVLLSHHAWLVDTGRHKILIDPCVGNHKNRQVFAIYNQLDTPWLERLAEAGAHPDEIDFVFCTHLHADHCGWNTQLRDGRWMPTFPNARYIFSRTELDYWVMEAEGQPPRTAYNAGVLLDSVKPVIDAGQALVIDGSLDLAGCLAIFPTPGHTPGHLSAILDAGDDGAVFTGDAIHHPLQLLHPSWNTAGCQNVADARRVRRQLLDVAADRKLLLAPAHFRGTRACRIARSGDGYSFEWAAP